jgi:hypothetical protein
MTKLQATKDYRSNLQDALRQAKRRLSPAELPIVAAGIVAEMNRIDREMEDLMFKTFMGYREEVPLFPRVIQIVQRAYAGFELGDAPSISVGHTSTGRNQIRQLPLTSERAVSPSLFESTSLSRGLSPAYCV